MKQFRCKISRQRTSERETVGFSNSSPSRCKPVPWQSGQNTEHIWSRKVSSSFSFHLCLRLMTFISDLQSFPSWLTLDFVLLDLRLTFVCNGGFINISNSHSNTQCMRQEVWNTWNAYKNVLLGQCSDQLASRDKFSNIHNICTKFGVFCNPNKQLRQGSKVLLLMIVWQQLLRTQNLVSNNYKP